jgi:sugar/nucleoside kinase (ribokinase family)
MSRIDIQLQTASKTASVTGSGFIALDIVHGRDGLFAAAGGSCGNVLTALAWLGWASTPVARLGCDKAGDLVIEDLKSAGANLDLLQRSETVPTPVVIQQFIDDGKGGRRHRFSLVCPECGAWLPRYRSVVLSHAREAVQGEVPKAFYFDRTSPATVAMAEWAKQNGSVVLFEPSSISEDALFERAVDACHILKFSNERFRRDSELSEARGPLLVVRTTGADGLQARWRGLWSSFEPFAAPKVVDTAGAGDWCSVALLHVLAQKGAHRFLTARKTDIERALRLGQALAALSCGFEGARGLMSATGTVERVDRLLRNLGGGSGVFEDVAIKAARTNKVEICKLCSGTGQAMAPAKEAKPARRGGRRAC